MNAFSRILAGLIPLAFVGGVNAALIGVSGNGAIIGAPGSVEDDGANCTNWSGEVCSMLGFDEKQNVTLASALGVDGVGSIAAGTQVSSHMIFLNSTPANDRYDLKATWEFDGVILGVMSDAWGTLEEASNGILGAAGTTYPGSFGNRGFENNQDTYSGIGTTLLETRMYVTEPGDWIRVVTAAKVPEPGTLALLGAGLLGLFGVRKRKV